MKTFRVILTILCVALILCMPMFLTSPNRMTPRKGSQEWEKHIEEQVENAVTEDDDSEVIDLDDLFGFLFVSTAFAEESVPPDDEVMIERLDDDGSLYINPEWNLPIDFSVPPKPNPANYTEN